MDIIESQIREGWRLMEDADAQRSAVQDAARKSQTKANLNVVKANRKKDLANIDSQIAAIDESDIPFDEGASSPALVEMVKELRLLRQVEIQNGTLLKAILDNL